MRARAAVQGTGWALLALAAVALGAFVVFWFGRPERALDADRRIESLCDLQYARARTRADTLIADRVDVGGKFNRVLCEDYRLNRRGAFAGGPRGGR
jgi:hypothetical protein